MAIVHVPVLLQEVLTELDPAPAARILDLTLGLGGHAEALLGRCGAEALYLGVDRDPQARAAAR
ncbi:MAG TPA: 16S rRNA (cytosine(1402)-N(4))-methyltransferase, partial [Holophaga sp.]|nr:16S rRNA (cytosine(1402)-N(4))-methyltransferase [Holophaga sp.]